MKEKSFWLGLIAKDNKEIERIEKARARRDDRFFSEWFDKYNKNRGRDFWINERGVGREKTKKDDYL
jgi:hypothetical protein